MVQSPKKGAFLGKLVRFVSNPTTDWASLDSVPSSELADGPELPEGAKFTQSEIMSMRNHRRKRNRIVRVKEFGMLRSISAKKSIPGVLPQDFNNAISDLTPTQPTDDKNATVTVPVTNIKSKRTNVDGSGGDFDVSKINNIELQMVEQWWDKEGEDSAPTADKPEMTRETPKLAPKKDTSLQTVKQKTDMVEDSSSSRNPPTQSQSVVDSSDDLDNTTGINLSHDTIPIDSEFLAKLMKSDKEETKESAILVDEVKNENQKNTSQSVSVTHEMVSLEPQKEVSVSEEKLVAESSAEPTVNQEEIESDVEEDVDNKASESDVILPVKEEHPVEVEAEDLHDENTKKQVAKQEMVASGAAEDVDTSKVDESDNFLCTLPVEEEQDIEDEVEDLNKSLADSLAVSWHVTLDELPESLGEPAILFAQGKDSEVETKLIEQSELLKEEVEKNPELEQQEPHSLLALLDYYRATKQEERFENAGLYMVYFFGRSAPPYYSIDLGHATRILSTITGSEFLVDGNQVSWLCPAELDLTEVMLLRSQLIEKPGQVLLDWRKLDTILDEAVEPLVDQIKDLSQRQIELLMWGGERLLACCKNQINAEKPPEKNIYMLLWYLRLELVRIMLDQSVFEEESLACSIALEESPPAWVKPKCFYIDADEAVDTLDDHQIDDTNADDGQILESNIKHPMQWKGSIRGSIQKLLTALDDACGSRVCIIDCLQLDRIDYIATTELLAWLMTKTATPKRIKFTNVNRLVAVFWRIMGIHMQADIELRHD